MTRDGGLLVGPGEGKVLQNPMGVRVVVKVGDGDADGSYSVHDNIIPARSPYPCLTSTAYHEETFYVLDGELTLRVVDSTFAAPSGSFIVIPWASSTSPRTRVQSRPEYC
jgi:mannose-6-phosphate isomerase-like protein (cupin superfamily)